MLALLVAPGLASAKSKRAALRTTRVLVTDDDGVKHPGLDQLVRALRREQKVKVVVSAPASDRSGTGGLFSIGSIVGYRTTTVSGLPAHAVKGYPYDSVRWAYGNLFKRRWTRPDIVISGVNRGANLGVGVERSAQSDTGSGTVDAARAGAERGAVGLAASYQLKSGTDSDYGPANTAVIRWFRENRARLDMLRGRTFNMNVPGCVLGGKPRGLVRAAYDRTGYPTAAVDCAQNGPAVSSSDLKSFYRGFVTVARIPTKPLVRRRGVPARS
jgi:5'-nucleotidase